MPVLGQRLELFRKPPPFLEAFLELPLGDGQLVEQLIAPGFELPARFALELAPHVGFRAMIGQGGGDFPRHGVAVSPQHFHASRLQRPLTQLLLVVGAGFAEQFAAAVLQPGECRFALGPLAPNLPSLAAERLAALHRGLLAAQRVGQLRELFDGVLGRDSRPGVGRQLSDPRPEGLQLAAALLQLLAAKPQTPIEFADVADPADQLRHLFAASDCRAIRPPPAILAIAERPWPSRARPG